MQGPCTVDSTVFITSVIGSCLLPLSKTTAAEPILSRVTDYLRYQMVGGGVWNFFSTVHPMRRILPYDGDSLSFASNFLLERGVQIPERNNKQLLLDNRARNGLFYTWFVLHPKLHTNRTLWRLSLRGLRTPVAYFLFMIRNAGHIDLGVNASVLSYLGDIPEVAPVINEVIRVIASNEEDDCDEWYRNPFAIYYLISRAYNRGVKKLQPVVSPIIERILATASADGQLGKSIFYTALGVTTLINFGCKSKELHQAISFLIKHQGKHGEWPRWLFFYINPTIAYGWGSEELTTAFCVEAIARYKLDCSHTN
ncbi:hypothetical protein [Chitinophaga niastensis]|nr:hypothetical protein [Chitinophaga niastensis]